MQALDNVSATSAVVSAQDCPVQSRVLHEFDACVRNSAKHSIVVSIKEDWEARSLIEMARALAGGRDELRARPTFTAIICTVSPLHQERFGMDLALTLAEAGIPVSFYPMPILGATGPITIAGSAVVNNAEFVSAATLVQLAHPGAPVIHGGGPTAMYMNERRLRQQLARGHPLRSVQGHMADFYGVPAWYGAGATTAKEPGIQSAYENTIAMFMAYANGADVTFGTGLLDGSRILCLENMVVDDEILGMIKRILRGVEVSDETIARDLIVKMGFNGSYLFDNHTRAHVRELWQAKLGETGTYEGWKSAGSPEHHRQGPGQGARDPRRRADRLSRRPRPRVRRDHRRGRKADRLSRAAPRRSAATTDMTDSGLTIRKADDATQEVACNLLRRYFAEEGLAAPAERQRAGLAALLADPRGAVLLALRDDAGGAPDDPSGPGAGVVTVAGRRASSTCAWPRSASSTCRRPSATAASARRSSRLRRPGRRTRAAWPAG